MSFPVSLRLGRLPLAFAAATLVFLGALTLLQTAPSLPSPSPAAERSAPASGAAAELIVRLRPGASPAAETAAIERAGGRVVRRLPIIRGLVVRAPAGARAALTRRPGVLAVSPNASVEATGAVDPGALKTSYQASIRADRVWNNGLTGKGVGVAVIDTGIAGDLPDFRVSQSDARSRVVVNAVTNPNASGPGDTYGHGTHVAGLIAGNSTNRDPGDPLYGHYAGAAPDADLIAIKVDDGRGQTTVADVIAGLQFAVDFRHDYNIRVINLSLRSSHAESYKTDPLDAAVEQAWFAGLVVVAAAGNGGNASDAVSYAPGNDPHVITVGAVDDVGTKDIDDDRLTSWSSRGVTQDGFEKPDLVAPGARLISNLAPGSYYASACPACVVDDAYLRIGGTSMAAAVVSGEIATLLQAYPDWTPGKVKATVARRTRAVYSSSSASLVDGGGDPVSTTSPTETIYGGEAAADKAVANPSSWVVPAIDPSTLLDPSTLSIDYERLSWSRLSWSEAPDALRASWSRLSWSRADFTRLSWSATNQSCADLERAGWTRLSWSDAEVQSAKDECLALDPTASWASADGVEPTRLSWSASFDR